MLRACPSGWILYGAALDDVAGGADAVLRGDLPPDFGGCPGVGRIVQQEAQLAGGGAGVVARAQEHARGSEAGAAESVVGLVVGEGDAEGRAARAEALGSRPNPALVDDGRGAREELPVRRVGTGDHPLRQGLR